MDEPKRHGGPGRGQGRKPIETGADTVPVSIRMTPTQKEKLARLGGPKWVRQKIDVEPDPDVERWAAQARGRTLEALDAFRRGEISQAELKAKTKELDAVNRAFKDQMKAARAAAKK